MKYEVWDGVGFGRGEEPQLTGSIGEIELMWSAHWMTTTVGETEHWIVEEDALIRHWLPVRVEERRVHRGR